MRKNIIEEAIKAKFMAEYAGKPVDNQTGWFYKDFDVLFYDSYVDAAGDGDEGYEIPTYSITAIIEKETKKGKKTDRKDMMLY